MGVKTPELTADEFVRLPVAGGKLDGRLRMPEEARGVVVFSDSGQQCHHGSVVRHVAQRLDEVGIGTLYVDLACRQEIQSEPTSTLVRTNTHLLAERLGEAVGWLTDSEDGEAPAIGLFGANYAGAASLVAAARMPGDIATVVSLAGRPDFVADHLSSVETPSLLVARKGQVDEFERNRRATGDLAGPAKLATVPGNSHPSEEFKTKAAVAELAVGWYSQHLWRPVPPTSLPDGEFPDPADFPECRRPN